LLALKFNPSKDPLVRLASLVHDIGKVPTYKKDAKGNVTFYGHEIVGARMIKETARDFALAQNKLINYILWSDGICFTVSEFQTDSAIRRFIRHVGSKILMTWQSQLDL